MGTKLATVALTGLAISAVCLSAVTALGAGDLITIDGWDDGFDRCERVDAGGADTRSLAWTGGDEVELSVPATVRYRPGTGDAVIVRGNPTALAHLRIEDGEIRFDCNMRRTGRLEITLPGVPMREFALRGSGTLILDDLDQQELDIAIAGSGDVRATGRADEVELNIAGSGDADLGSLAVRRLELRIAGSGDAEVAPRETADISIAGSGDVRFVVQPANVTTRIVGSGRIVNAPAASAPAP